MLTASPFTTHSSGILTPPMPPVKYVVEGWKSVDVVDAWKTPGRRGRTREHSPPRPESAISYAGDREIVHVGHADSIESHDVGPSIS